MELKVHEKVENKIIDLINEDSGGRLVISKPEKSDFDLVIEKRGNYTKKPIFLNIYLCEKPLSSLSPYAINLPVGVENFYLVFVYFNVIKQDIEDKILFIPFVYFNQKIGGDYSEFFIDKMDIGKILFGKIGK